MRYQLILNPAAGRSEAGKLQSAIIEACRRELNEVQVHITKFPGHATEIATSLKHHPVIVIAAGGDGTVNEVVNGIIGGQATLGVIPIGSGNDFVKTLKLPLDYREAISVIKKGNSKRIDIGKANGVYFANGIGIGFDALVVEESEKITALRGFAIYLVAVLKTLRYFKNIRVDLDFNDVRDKRDIFMISLGNGIAMGGGFYLTPQAKIDDGELDVCIIHKLSKLQALVNLPKAIKGNHHTMKQVTFHRMKEFKLFSEAGVPVHADGELISKNMKELSVSVLPAALEVIHNLAE